VFSLLIREFTRETGSLLTGRTAIPSAVAETIARRESEPAGFERIRGVWGGSGFGSPPETVLLKARWSALGRKFSAASLGGGLSGFHGCAVWVASPVGSWRSAWDSALERVPRLQLRHLFRP
jgi:hypothetical protein